MAATAALDTEAVENAPTPDETPAGGEGSEGSASGNKPETVQLSFRIPVALKDLVEAKGKEDGNLTAAEWSKRYVASAFDFALPPPRQASARTKYAGLSKEERAERIKQDKVVRNAIAKALLARFEKGEIRLDENGLVGPDGQAITPEAIQAALNS